VNSSEVLPCGVRVHYQSLPSPFARYRVFIGGKTYGVVSKVYNEWFAVPRQGRATVFDTRGKAAQYLVDLGTIHEMAERGGGPWLTGCCAK